MRLRSQRGYTKPESGKEVTQEEGGSQNRDMVEIEERDEFNVDSQCDLGNPLKDDHRIDILTEQHMTHEDDGVKMITSSRKELLEEKGKSKNSVDDETYDDMCMVCGDGGDLVCCDGCPTTFHQSCLDMETLPTGGWYCVYCRCKYCGIHSKPFDRFSDDSLDSVLLTCRSCWQRYHNSCIDGGSDSNIHCKDTFACGSKCLELLNRLKMLIGVKHEIEDGFYWSLVRWTDINARIKPANRVECNSKVVRALPIIKSCFTQIIDEKTGIDIVSSVLYNQWSQFPRLNFEGFVTAILEKGDEITSVASIRIHEGEMAEIPFVGTDYNYRKQGMCRRLMNGIESALSYLNVELLILPSVLEATETWTSCFGFEPIDLSTQKLMKEKHIMLFSDTDKLQKKMLKLNASYENLSFIEVFNLHKNQKVHRKPNNYIEADGSESSSRRRSRGYAAREVSPKRARCRSI